MTVDDLLDLFFGEYEIYDLDNEKTVFDSCFDSIDDNDYFFETVSSIDIENDKLIINI